MADTVGSLIDKLSTVGFKMFNEQEKLYDIRRLSFEEFRDRYKTEKELKTLYDYFHKACDLNIQRNQYIDEIDQKLIDMLRAAMNGTNLNDTNFIQRKHKTL